METSPRPNAAVTVWIDGECAVCRRSEAWCSARDTHHRLEFKNIHEVPDGNLPRPHSAMMSAVHIVRPNGSVAAGFDAWREILSALDGWRWLGIVSGWPGVQHLGRLVYRVIARWRHALGGRGSRTHPHGSPESPHRP